MCSRKYAYHLKDIFSVEFKEHFKKMYLWGIHKDAFEGIAYAHYKCVSVIKYLWDILLTI